MCFSVVTMLLFLHHGLDTFFFFFSLKTKQKILYTPLAVIAKWKGIDMYLDLQNFIYMQYFTGSSSRDNCTSE